MNNVYLETSFLDYCKNNNQNLTERYLTSNIIKNQIESWAIHSDIFFQHFKKITNKKDLLIKKNYLLSINNRIDRKRAIKFFYMLRSDQLDGYFLKDFNPITY
jgi:hypothetical protein